MCYWAANLLQQLPEPVQLWLQLFVVVLQYLHAGLQSSFVLPQQLGLGDKLGITGALRRHRQHLGGRRQRRQALPVVGFLQAVVLRLQLPAGRERAGSLASAASTDGGEIPESRERWTFVWLIKQREGGRCRTQCEPGERITHQCFNKTIGWNKQRRASRMSTTGIKYLQVTVYWFLLGFSRMDRTHVRPKPLQIPLHQNYFQKKSELI